MTQSGDAICGKVASIEYVSDPVFGYRLFIDLEAYGAATTQHFHPGQHVVVTGGEVAAHGFEILDGSSHDVIVRLRTLKPGTSILDRHGHVVERHARDVSADYALGKEWWDTYGNHYSHEHLLEAMPLTVIHQGES